jgi:hypothetical protein
MKKIFLLTTVLFQVVFLFGQSTEWSQWQTVKCFKGLQFRTRQMTTEPNNFNQYIQFKNNYAQKVAFSFVVKEGINESNDYIEKYGGQYRTELDAGATDDGLMWVALKNNNVAYLTVGYLRFLINDEMDLTTPFEGCDDRTWDVCHLCQLKPKYHCNNYDDSKPSTIKQTENNNSSITDPENTIIKNIKLFLNDYVHLIYDYTDKIQDVTIKDGELQISIHQESIERTYKCPYTIDDYLYIMPIKSISLESVAENSFSIPLQLLRIKSNQNISRVTTRKNIKQDVCKVVSNIESSDFLDHVDFEYNFGANDENYIELQNAIEALKNPNKNFASSGNQSGNVQQKPKTISQNNVSEKNNSTTSDEIDLDVEESIIQANDISKSKLTSQQLILKSKEFYNNKDWFNYTKYEEAAAIKGDVEAMVSMGHNYRGGITVGDKSIITVDYKKAKYWFQKASNNGNTNGTNGLAFIYQNGWGEDIDYKKAVEYYTISANMGPLAVSIKNRRQ